MGLADAEACSMMGPQCGTRPVPNGCDGDGDGDAEYRHRAAGSFARRRRRRRRRRRPGDGWWALPSSC
uniref:Uncharacterized protein n=1 Tax=Oryza meridionalis TaxID=40149 RepID=A0A0E0FDQ1_9ORYZ